MRRGDVQLNLSGCSFLLQYGEADLLNKLIGWAEGSGVEAEDQQRPYFNYHLPPQVLC
jgi:hypothetical protein